MSVAYQMFNMFRNFKKISRTINSYALQKIHCPTILKANLESQITTNCKFSTIIVEKDESITLIGINREKARNSLNAAALVELNQAIKAFEEDASSPVAVLYGIGGSFCTGYDVAEIGSSDNWLLQQNSIARQQLQKPIIAGISGFCVGIGCEIAMNCDLRVMEDTAIFGFFNRYLGVPMCDGGTVRLAKIVGYARALDIILSGRRVSAKEAFEIGLINRIVATGTALGQAVNLAICIAKFTQKAIHHDRTSIYDSVYEAKTFNETVQNEVMLTTKEVLEEMQVGVRKFKESFTKGAKVDSFNIKEKEIPDWEKEEIEREKQYAKRKILDSRDN